MLVFRITLQKWAGSLVASGRAARWNSNGRFVFYTAGSRALACLENIVHRKSIGNADAFKVMVIEIPDRVSIEIIKKEDLEPAWIYYTSYAYCQAIGDEWIKRATGAVLRVPSALVPEESNYLINPQHPEFSRIKIVSTEDFSFDDRLSDPSLR